MSGLMARSYYCPRFSSSWSWRSTSGSTSSGSFPCRMRRSLRATTSWRTSSAQPASVPELPGRPLGEQLGQLGLDVERRLAAGALPVGLRLEHLADLGLAPRPEPARRAVAGSLGQVGVELDRELALADLLQGVPGAEHEGGQRDRDRHQDDDQDRLAGAEAERQRWHRPGYERRAGGASGAAGTGAGGLGIPVSFVCQLVD